jgi:hypothetical protein
MGEYHSLTAIDEAIARTTGLLWPPSPSLWVRILVITLFLGGGIMNPFPGNLSIGEGTTLEDLIRAPVIPPDLLLGLGALFFLVLGIYSLFSSIFQFVFVDTLRSDTILLCGSIRSHIREGIGLFGFYLILAGAVAGSLVLVMVAVMVPLIRSGDQSLPAILTAVIITLVALFLILIPVWIIAILTSDFVVPVMIADRLNVYQGWRRFLTIFTGRWLDLILFVGLKIMISICTGVVLGSIIFLTGLIFGVPELIITPGGISAEIFTISVFIQIFLFSGLTLLLSLMVTAPVITFLRFYSLIMIGRINSRYLLITPRA